jgi:hypothetical protein
MGRGGGWRWMHCGATEAVFCNQVQEGVTAVSLVLFTVADCARC